MIYSSKQRIDINRTKYANFELYETLNLFINILVLLFLAIIF